MAVAERSIALIDCNNFFVSCERVFNPALEGKPVLVLSSNDGCVIARSQEVKDLGVKMGVPWYQVKNLATRHKIIALSSNFTLYADMSNRVMRIIAGFSPHQEVYSIDESFLDLTTLKHINITEYGQRIRATIKKWVGLPVCVGVGASKTLAKLANHLAKKRPIFAGVCDLNAIDPVVRDRLFSEIKVGEVWGAGKRTEKRLVELGIHTVLDFKRAKGIRKQFSVVLERTVMELNGESCLPVTEVAPPQKQMTCSRSFGGRVFSLDQLEEAVIAHTTHIAEKLRQQKSVTALVYVFIQTSPFRDKDTQYSGGHLVPLREPTDDTRLLIAAALSGLCKIYRSGFAYQKAGVLLSELSPAGHQQGSLFDEVEAPSPSRANSLMQAIDGINGIMGSGTIKFLGEGLNKQWQTKSDTRTPCYTTSIDDIPIAKA